MCSDEVTRELANDPDVTRLAAGPPAGDEVGPYRLLQKIGEGGMGEVWVAEQREPIHRVVAVKVIKIGMDTRQVVARFEAERQLLAQMDHPGIAKVLDAGATANGRPYFVMEYVRGEPLTTYCDRHRLTTIDRLRLFVRVCEAVQHAHQKGVIHRDLKPSNILVAIQDEQPVPKIIDFGIAKATMQRQAERTVFTELGVLIGTPEYMSPEQAEMTTLDVDTRTDVYSLGVVLYELLAGALPIDVTSLRQAGIDEVRRQIREVDPPRPSTRVSTVGDASAVAARNRKTEPVRLVGQLRGDLDWITMKALEKDRTRRYGTVSDLAADIERHLSDLPVLATPQSAAYQARKFVRRHRFGVGAAAAFIALLIAFGVTMAVQAKRIAGERDRANREAVRANLEAETAGQVADFLAGLFRVADPAESRGREVSAREILDKGAARITKELARDPVLEARLLLTMGDVYRSLGLLDESQRLLEQSLDIRRRVLGPEAPDTLRSASLLGAVYDLAGETDRAEEILTSTLETERRVLGSNHRDTLKTLADLANVYDSQGRYEKSVPMMEDVFERRRKALGADDPDTLASQYNLAVGLYREGRLGEAERMLKEVAASFARVVGPDHPNTLLAKNLLASVYLGLGRPRDAGSVLEDVYRARMRVLGPDHMDTLAAKQGLANVALAEGRYAEAEKLLREALAVQERTLGPDHSDTIATRASLATALSDSGRDDEAERMWRDTLARMQRTLGVDHPSTSNCFVGLAVIEMRRGRRQAALELLERAVRLNPLWGPKVVEDERFAALRGMAAFDALASGAGTTRESAQDPAESEDR